MDTQRAHGGAFRLAISQSRPTLKEFMTMSATLHVQNGMNLWDKAGYVNTCD